VFRCKPDGSQLEVFAFGLRNPQALLFTETGDLFTADNDSDHGDEERLVHVVEGGDSGWRVGYQYAPLGRAGPWNSEKMWHPRHAGQPAFMLPPIVNIEDGPSGITYYPGTGLRPEYRGTLFVTHYRNGSLARSGIFTYKVKPDGASHEIADAKLFLGQALPTDAKFSPDGRLFFSDWADHHSGTYRGRIYSIRDTTQARNALPRETQELMGGDWTKRTAAELGRLLGHADWRVRLEAQFELADRSDAGLTSFADVLKNSTGYARLHAVWGLGQLAEKLPAALGPVRAALRDADAEVRAQSAKVLGDRRSQ
jgi:quinoprotein glucose dehydrogenase